jgi:hypothetical protein
MDQMMRVLNKYPVRKKPAFKAFKVEILKFFSQGSDVAFLPFY